MAPRKPAKATPPAAPLPPPNVSHPCYSLVETSQLPDRPHSSSYHVFFESTTSRAGLPPPKKKQKKADELPVTIEGAWQAARIQNKMLEWFDAKRGERTMPWRKDGVPSEMTKKERSQRGYEVWVSEIMLQQTQVATCVSYYERWIAKFPTVIALSKASIDDVNAIWTGLGYYSRAKRLLEGAQTVVRDFGGYVPENVEDLLTIEGIGPYSAGAISSIAFGKRAALVDGNVTRVLSRLTALHAPSTAKATTSFVWALADSLVPANEQLEDDSEEDGKSRIKNRPGSWNQGLMELGATVCTPKNPKCGECPISEECLGYQEARYNAHRSKKKATTSQAVEVDVEDLCTLCSPLPPLENSSKGVEIYPMAKERKKQREEETAVCLVEWEQSENAGSREGGSKKDRKVLAMKRPEKGLLAGLLEFPSVDLAPSPDSTLSTPSARSKHLSNLLRNLIDLPSDFKLASSSIASGGTDGEVKVSSLRQLEPVVHVYSHIIRTYYTTHIVLESSSLPTLLSSSSSSSSTSKSKSKPKSTTKKKTSKQTRDSSSSSSSEEEEEEGEPSRLQVLVQSQPGKGKWIESSLVESESFGGAMKKVWESSSGTRTDTVGKRKSKVGTRKENGGGGGGGGGGGEKKKSGEKEVEKGQKSLFGFFGGKSTTLVTKEKEDTRQQGTGDGQRDDDDDDVVIIEEERVKQEVRVRKEGEATAVEAAAVGEEKAYKKRRIAPTSDEEDEG